MGWQLWTIIGGAAAVAIYAVFQGNEAEAPPMEDGWWGKGPRSTKEDKTIRPFKIQVPDDVITDLKTRLTKTRLNEDLEATQFQYGFQAKYLKEVLSYWKDKYDWKKHQEILNSFPQFKTTIEGIDVHFIHVKPAASQTKARPIIITHGWPGSVWEFYKLIPRLTNPEKYDGQPGEAFEVICPSIPGYGFSESPHQQGFSPVSAARIFHKLMLRLGQESYYAQGGDWGSMVSTIMAQAYPENVIGVHLNFFPAPVTPGAIVKHLVSVVAPSLVLHPDDQKAWKSLGYTLLELLKESGYFHIQSTKPDTVAAGLNDSPAGLAAYILEKFSTWTDRTGRDLPDGGLTKKFTLDELLTDVMIYWIQGNIGPSMRFYKEHIGSEKFPQFDKVPVMVPTGLAAFPDELLYEPEAFMHGKFPNIVQFTRMPRGGHFAALEEPELLANDIVSFVRKIKTERE